MFAYFYYLGIILQNVISNVYYVECSYMKIFSLFFVTTSFRLHISVQLLNLIWFTHLVLRFLEPRLKKGVYQKIRLNNNDVHTYMYNMFKKAVVVRISRVKGTFLPTSASMVSVNKH